jgi:hypothetical protein
MTQTLTRRSITAPLRDWLRTQNVAGVDGSGDQVYAGGLPTGTTGGSIVLFRVGGQTDGPIERPLIQFDVRAATGSAAEAIAAALLALLESTQAGTALTSTLHFMGCASVTEPIWSPDQPGDTPRYVITVELAVKALP